MFPANTFSIIIGECRILQWFLRGGSSTRYWELPADVKSLRMALSLVELHNPFKEGITSFFISLVNDN
uniref:Uncharacterized protein n=1 Tax=Parascaris equorum TaxID=6256 RepID=A0A914S3E6_PAREQ